MMFETTLFERLCGAVILSGCTAGMSCIVYVMWAAQEIPLLMAIIVSLIVVPCILLVLNMIKELLFDYF